MRKVCLIILAALLIGGCTTTGPSYDRERSLSGWNSWASAEDYLRYSSYGLRYDHWAEQEQVVEVWVEKKALVSIVTRACSDLRVDHFACTTQPLVQKPVCRQAPRPSLATGLIATLLVSTSE